MTEGKRILIVDDEPLARQRIERYLRAEDASFLIEMAENGLAAIESIARFRPEIVFLDVEMPGLNGFEVLQQLETRDFQIIFQTGHDEFAIRAFEEAACDYLLKPFTADRLRQALDRARTRVADEARLRALESRPGYGRLRRLTIKQGGRLRIIEARDIFCFVSRDHVTCLYFEEEGILREGICDLSLGRLLERLEPDEFLQLHRSNIVRRDALRALTRAPDGSVSAELPSGLRLPVSRNGLRKAKAWLRESDK